MLQHEGFNPIIGEMLPEIIIEYDISPQEKFITAFTKALEKLRVTPQTIHDMRSSLKTIEKSARILNLLHLTIAQIKCKHIKIILDHISKIKPNFSDRAYNKCRTYLMMLYKELVELETVEYNPIKELSKRTEEPKRRDVMTIDQRILVDNHLKKTSYEFWRYMHIFFHSGARVKELYTLQVRDVDLDRQVFNILVKKGKAKKWQERTINNTALPLWIELLNGANPEDYVFSKGLMPGPKKILWNQVTGRWERLVKKPLGIKADFYSLKHTRSTLVSRQFGEHTAALQNGHTNTAMVVSIYNVEHKEMQHEQLKNQSVSFVG